MDWKLCLLDSYNSVGTSFHAEDDSSNSNPTEATWSTLEAKSPKFENPGSTSQGKVHLQGSKAKESR